MDDTASAAPGGPGFEPRWTPASKEALGTARSSASHVCFTVSAGILNEVDRPTIDRPQIRDLKSLVTDGEIFFHDERHGELPEGLRVFVQCAPHLDIAAGGNTGRVEAVGDRTVLTANKVTPGWRWGPRFPPTIGSSATRYPAIPGGSPARMASGRRGEWWNEC